MMNKLTTKLSGMALLCISLGLFAQEKKEIKLEKLTPNKVYFDVATQRPLFFDGTGLKPIE